MSLVKNAVIRPQEIIDYLRSHPDFFIEHPEILTSLNIPHINPGDNVSSLVEYQIMRLRQQLSGLQENRGLLEQRSNNNKKFITDIHVLSLQLFSSTDLYDYYARLNKGLKKLYFANRVLLIIFTDVALNSNHPDLRFPASISNFNFMFTELFHRNKPLCDSLQEEYLQLLFAGEYDTVKSTVIVPIVNDRWHGLLVLAADEVNQYRQGTRLDMLVYIRDITQLMLHKFIG